MSERTRQIVLGAFLSVVLALTVGSVGLFAAQLRQRITSLGPPVAMPQLGFEICMPRGWEREVEGLSALFSTLAYSRPLDSSARLDSLTQRTPKRQIFFFSIRPGASDEQAVVPLRGLVKVLNENDNEFYAPQPIEPRQTHLGKYERREGGVVFRHRHFAYPVVLVRYHQITAGQRVFWCIMVGNTKLDEAGQALLRAVAASFRLLSDESA